MPKVSAKKIKDAIPKSAGIISTIASRCGYEWHTVKKAIDNSEELTALYTAEQETVLDMAEGILYKSVQAGDTGDAKWLLSRKGKNRGWADKMEVENSGTVNVKVKGYGKFTPDEWDKDTE